MSTVKTILIVGGSGLVGTHLALKLREGYKVYATYNSRPVSIPGVTYLPFDTNNVPWSKRVIFVTCPDIVIYAVGSNSMEWAEANIRDAERVHTSGPASVCNIAEVLQPKFIFLSNCYVFDGQKGNYKPNDTMLPATTMGKTKIGGENFVRGRSMNHIILRTSPVFGRGNGLRPNWFDTFRIKLEKGERIEASHFETHSYTSVYSMIDVISKCIETGQKNKAFHYGGLTKISEYEFARLFAKRFGYNPELVVPKRLAADQPPPTSPEWDYSLNSTQTIESLKVKSHLIEESFDLLEKQLVPSL